MKEGAKVKNAEERKQEFEKKELVKKGRRMRRKRRREKRRGEEEKRRRGEEVSGQAQEGGGSASGGPDVQMEVEGAEVEMSIAADSEVSRLVEVWVSEVKEAGEVEEDEEGMSIL